MGRVQPGRCPGLFTCGAFSALRRGVDRTSLSGYAFTHCHKCQSGVCQIGSSKFLIFGWPDLSKLRLADPPRSLHVFLLWRWLEPGLDPRPLHAGHKEKQGSEYAAGKRPRRVSIEKSRNPLKHERQSHQLQERKYRTVSRWGPFFGRLLFVRRTEIRRRGIADGGREPVAQ